jgi:hypothetical protein
MKTNLMKFLRQEASKALESQDINRDHWEISPSNLSLSFQQ